MRFLTVILGGAHTVAAILSQSMNEDGINYLDMGAVWLRGDWQAAVNGIWSPLYSWILGVVVGLTQPSVWREFPTVQVVNFAIYIAALLCFEFFWTELTRRYRHGAPDRQGTIGFGPAIWMTLGYSLFIWSSLNLIEIWSVSPDMTVAACVYVAAGLLLRVENPRNTVLGSALLGAVLGVGYLAKAALFPLGLAALALWAVVCSHENGGRGKRVAVALLAFFVVAGPFLTALSVKNGRVTFSEVSKFTYLKHVNGMNYPYPELSPDRMTGIPEHPPRRILDESPVYEFAAPVGGTYPLAYDPGYWTEGIRPVIGLDRQVLALASNGAFYFDLFVRQQGMFLGALLLLGALSLRGLPLARFRTPETALVLWSVAAFAMYALVYAIPRYIAPFVLLLWAGLLSGVRLPDTIPSRRMVSAGGIVLVLAVWLNIGALNLEGFTAFAGISLDSRAATGQFSDGHSANHPAIAEELEAMGLSDGVPVAYIGYSFTAYWARLARLRIVAEVDPKYVDEFWNSSQETRSKVISAFADVAAVAVIAEPLSDGSTPAGWLRLGETGYLLKRLR